MDLSANSEQRGRGTNEIAGEIASNHALALARLGLARPLVAGTAQQVEVAPGITVTRKTYPVPANEAPFFDFVEKTPRQREVDDHLVTEALKIAPDRAKAAQYAIGSGWRELLANRDPAAAARRFNQAFLLEPHQSGIYQGFAAVVETRSATSTMPTSFSGWQRA